VDGDWWMEWRSRTSGTSNERVTRWQDDADADTDADLKQIADGRWSEAPELQEGGRVRDLWCFGFFVLELELELEFTETEEDLERLRPYSVYQLQY